MKELFVGGEAGDQKDVVFTGEDASDIHTNKMDV
jgi:hypothetical protein